jgi:hypothetical protein
MSVFSDKLIQLSTLKFMHSFIHKQLPISFHGMWIFNRERLPDRDMRNADLLYIVLHKFATLKRMPLLSFPAA